MDQDIMRKVNAPALGLLVFGVIGIIFAIFSMLGSAFDFGLSSMTDMYGDADERIASFIGGGFGLISSLIGLGVSGLIIFGALKMQKMEQYELGVIASVLSIVPCISPCCILGLPFGIWGLVVLLNPEVKEAFKARKAQHNPNQ